MRQDSGAQKEVIRHTKQYRERVTELTNAKRLYRSMVYDRKNKRPVSENAIVDLLELAECGETTITSVAQWKAALQLAQANITNEEQKLKEEDMSDRAEAKRKCLYAASMSGNFRMLKMLICPAEVIKVAVDPKEFATYTANLSDPPPGWQDLGVHLMSQLELWDFFGYPPGQASDAINKWLQRPLSRSEVLEAWQGKKASSGPGVDGIPFCVRQGLVRRLDEDPSLDIVDVDIFFSEVFKEAKQSFSDWKVLLDRILSKGGKDDYTANKAYRNISCAVIPAKTLGYIYWTRLSEWLQMTGRGGGMQVFGKRKGFPGATFAIKVLNTMLMTAWHHNLNILVLMLDLDSFYPRLLKWVVFAIHSSGLVSHPKSFLNLTPSAECR